MSNYRTHAKLAGLLFLIAIVASIVGGGIIESVIGVPDPLANAHANATTLSWASALEFVNGLAVIGIGALLYPVMRQHSEALATGYISLRITEAVFYLVGAMIPILVLRLTAGGASSLDTVLAVRTLMMEFAVPVFLGLGGIILYVTMHSARLLPRFLTIWGLIGAITMMIANVWSWSVPVQIALVLPILLNEIVLGIWLIVVGFSNPKTE